MEDLHWAGDEALGNKLVFPAKFTMGRMVTLHEELCVIVKQSQIVNFFGDKFLCL